MGPDPAVAAVRLAVRRALPPPGSTVLVACSGGPDSLALLAATVFEGHKRDVRVIGVVVDHGLQPGSAAHTTRVVDQMAGLGVDETAAVRVTVDPGPQGVEAGARTARYAALDRLGEHFGADLLLLGHTLDDQAETVLLGLARGSGGRSIAGMRRGFDRFRRPLLDLTREATEAACRAQGITWWQDPHNADPRFTRARVRHTVLPLLERELGPGVAEALARTADMVREDVDALDDLAEWELEQVCTEGGLGVAALADRPDAVRRRLIRLAALRAGSPGTELTRGHVLAVDALVGDWHGQQGVDLPGPVRVTRVGDGLVFQRADA